MQTTCKFESRFADRSERFRNYTSCAITKLTSRLPSTKVRHFPRILFAICKETRSAPLSPLSHTLFDPNSSCNNLYKLTYKYKLFKRKLSLQSFDFSSLIITLSRLPSIYFNRTVDLKVPHSNRLFISFHRFFEHPLTAATSAMLNISGANNSSNNEDESGATTVSAATATTNVSLGSLGTPHQVHQVHNANGSTSFVYEYYKVPDKDNIQWA